MLTDLQYLKLISDLLYYLAFLHTSVLIVFIVVFVFSRYLRW